MARAKEEHKTSARKINDRVSLKTSPSACIEDFWATGSTSDKSACQKKRLGATGELILWQKRHAM